MCDQCGIDFDMIPYLRIMCQHLTMMSVGCREYLRVTFGSLVTLLETVD